jgi:hypothetical protein
MRYPKTAFAATSAGILDRDLKAKDALTSSRDRTTHWELDPGQIPSTEETISVRQIEPAVELGTGQPDGPPEPVVQPEILKRGQLKQTILDGIEVHGFDVEQVFAYVKGLLGPQVKRDSVYKTVKREEAAAA